MCGLAGIINKTPREFDYSAFCTLGIANDSRGGDSCGVFIDGNVEYGVKDQKYFSYYFPESELLFNTEKAKVAVLHCRKASVGAVNVHTAQPVVLRDKEGNVLFVVLHNGTIYNYEELAKKYIPNVNITGMTDSQVMAYIFYYKGYDVLNEYNGGSCFVIIDYQDPENPRTLLFKGASKKTEYSQVVEEERPLDYCIDPIKEELIFSSLGTYLLALRKNLNAWKLPVNILCEFDGKRLLNVGEYPRTNCIQTKKFPKTVYVSKDDWHKDYGKYLVINLTDNSYACEGKRVDGELYISRYGYVRPSTKNLKIDYKPFWFFDGILMKNKACYNYLQEFRKKSGLNNQAFLEKYQTLVRYLSFDGLFRKDGLMYQALSPSEMIPYSGEYQPLTSGTLTEYAAGRATSNNFYKGAKELEYYAPKELTINFKELEKCCK